LLQAEGMLEFLFEELVEKDNRMSNLLLLQLKVEIGKRRNKSLVSLLRFLADINSLTNQTVDPFFAMSYRNHQNGKDIRSAATQSYQSIVRNVKKPRVGDDDFDSISKEVNIYAAICKISENFKNLKEALGTISPTSTENEHTFSTSGNFL
jgi:hypothetical protein